MAKSDRADRSGDQLTHRRLVHGTPATTPWIVHWPLWAAADRNCPAVEGAWSGRRRATTDPAAADSIYMDNLKRLVITAALAMWRIDL